MNVLLAHLDPVDADLFERSAYVPTSPGEEALITLARWRRQSEALLLKRLYGEAPEAADEEPAEGAHRDPPYVLTEAQERINYHFEEDW